MVTKNKTKNVAAGNVSTPINPAAIDPAATYNTPFDEYNFVSIDNVQQLDDDLRPIYDEMLADWQEKALSLTQRLSMRGAGVRRYGFNDKVSDFALSNPEFIPPYLNVTKFKTNLRESEMLRDIKSMLEQMLRITNDLLLVTDDEVFRQALMYYNSVHEASKRRVPGAEQVYRMLNSFFKKGRRTSEEPTEQQIIHDVHSLLHGKKEGEIVIKNEGKKVTKGKKVVIDETHKPKGEWKVTESGEISD